MGDEGRDDRRPSREERRTQLLEAAVEAIRTIGAGASMEQLAKQGGVTKPILYRHFGDRDGLVDAIAAQYAAHLIERLEAPLGSDEPSALLRHTVDSYLQFLEDDPELYRFLMHQASRAPKPADDREPSALIDVVGRQVSDVITGQLRERGLPAAGADPMGFGVVGMVHLAGDWWIRNRTMSRADLTDHLTVLLWHGFSGLRRATEGLSTPDSAAGSALH